jgi:hypothetical protein
MPQREQTPLTAVEVWGITSTSRIWIGGNNVPARRAIELLVGNMERPPTGEIDRAFLAPSTTDEAVYFARKLRSRLAADSFIWIVYPKRGSPAEHEFAGDFEEMIVALFELGYVERGRTHLLGDYTSTGFHLSCSHAVP